MSIMLKLRRASRKNGLTQDEHYQAYVATSIVEAISESFWRRLQDGTRHAYGDTFDAAKADPLLVDEQRPHALLQSRYYRMEHTLLSVARETGVAGSATLIGENNCRYAYAARGRVGMTQSYVQAFGQMPRPANFRQHLAQVAAFKRQGELDLGDRPEGLITPKQVTGILLHSPTGHRFVREDQMLGDIGFYVPYEDFNGWAAHLSLSEILSLYAPAETREDRAAPMRKSQGKTGTEDK